MDSWSGRRKWLIVPIATAIAAVAVWGSGAIGAGEQPDCRAV